MSEQIITAVDKLVAVGIQRVVTTRRCFSNVSRDELALPITPGHSLRRSRCVSTRDAGPTRGAQNVAEFIRRLTFNALIGNGDMHLKNWSVLYRDRRNASLTTAEDRSRHRARDGCTISPATEQRKDKSSQRCKYSGCDRRSSQDSSNRVGSVGPKSSPAGLLSTVDRPRTSRYTSRNKDRSFP